MRPRNRLSRSLVRSRRQTLAHHLLAEPVVADEGHAAVRAHVARRGLADVVQERAEAERLAACELVGERLGEQLAQLGVLAETSAAGRARSGALAAPRACGRTRPCGGSGSARRRGGPPARAAPRAAGRGVGQREPLERAAAPARAGELGEDALGRDASVTRGAAARVSRSGLGVGLEPSSAAKRARRSGRSGSPRRPPPERPAAARASRSRPAAERVDQLAARERLGHRVDREVPLRQVLLDRRRPAAARRRRATRAAVDDAPGAERLGEREAGAAALAARSRARPPRGRPPRRCRGRSTARPSSASRTAPPTIQAGSPPSASRAAQRPSLIARARRVHARAEIPQVTS